MSILWPNRTVRTMQSVRKTVLLSLCIAAPLFGQTIRGSVFLPDSVTPAAGIVVSAVAENGNTVAGSLTTRRGEFSLALPAAGTYRLRALRIGFRPTELAGIRAVIGAVQAQRIVLSDRPVSVAAVIVREKRDCGISGRDADTFLQLWDQARGALLASRLTEQSGSLDARIAVIAGHVDATSFLRDPKLGPYLRAPNPDADTAHTREVIVDKLFATESPETLFTAGYVRRRRDSSVVFDAPNAEVLLSDEFVSGHCFSVVGALREHPGWVGIGFEPRATRGNLVDVRGVVWLEDSTAELRRVEIEYTNLPPTQFELCDPDPDQRRRGFASAEPACQTFRDATRLGLGATTDFVRLPAGEWIASRWVVRTPPDALVWRFSGLKSRENAAGNPETCSFGKDCRELWVAWPRLVTISGTVASVRRGGFEIYHNQDGEALIAAATRIRAGPHPAKIVGTISGVGGHPLANAIVQIQDPGRAGLSDSSGFFEITMLPATPVVVTASCQGYRPLRFTIPLAADVTRHLRLELVPIDGTPQQSDCSQRQPNNGSGRGRQRY